MANYDGKTYEFVSKSKAQPVKNELDAIIKKIQKEMRKEKITFIPVLVGSAGRNLITQVVGGNSGFDFDYNFALQKCEEKNAKRIKDLFMNAVNNAIKGTKYSNAEDGTQAITIKVVDKKNSKIIHSCDFAIINEYEENEELFQEILIHNKDTQKYIWNKRSYAKNYASKVSNIVSNGIWGELKTEYLKLKNKNMDREKKSFSLYFEALNNVYNRYEWN